MLATSAPTTAETSPRSLVRDILSIQLAFAAIVGLIALASVWGISRWVVRDNVDKWSNRWMAELQTLGAGLYLQDDSATVIALRGYLDRYDELLYIRYYDAAGQPLYVESNLDTLPFAPLGARPLREMRAQDADNSLPWRDERDSPLVRMGQAVITESISRKSDLMSAESLDDLRTRKRLVGFVEIGLDYSRYDADLLQGAMAGSAAIVVAFLLLALFGGAAIRRGLAPLSALEAPLKRLAQGELDITVPLSTHREIETISEAIHAAATAIRERDQHLRKLASYDQLTGLANRRYFLERLEQLGAHNTGAMLFIDLDQFKYVNDTLGHRGGDLILAQVAERLRHAVRPGDLIARVGGDEFVIFLQNVERRRAQQLGQQVVNDLKEYPLSQDGHTFNVGCSIGIAMVERNNPFTATEIVSQADLACRQAKIDGRNRICIYELVDDDLASVQTDLQWQQRLKAALRNHEFELHYQPIQHVGSGGIQHYEALIRLRDGDKLVFPDAFLSAARRFALMTEIDQWVISTAIAELAVWRRDLPDLKIGINLTGSTFIESGFSDFVLRELDRHHVPADRIIFEITEQVAISSFSDAVPQIRALVERGCEFAVDDFGTGYSSLSYLKRLPVKYIKIDGVFIRKLVESEVDQTIVKAIVDIARIMGKETIAEFVGDAATAELIQRIGIDYAQGFHIGKPARDSIRIACDNARQLQVARA